MFRLLLETILSFFFRFPISLRWHACYCILACYISFAANKDGFNTPMRLSEIAYLSVLVAMTTGHYLEGMIERENSKTSVCDELTVIKTAETTCGK